ncbi:FxDxF family PEP-CTERM protein [Massilia sp. W12]|uniref:FxDxF family PEP-CTERM protein n=1 Tax=Massilia sp. W12 TaxID=3126507 RepID=UPI0030D35673
MKKIALTAIALAAAMSFNAHAVQDISHSPTALTLNSSNNSINFGGKFAANNKDNFFADKFTFTLNSVYHAEAIVSSISASASTGLALTGFSIYNNAGQLVFGGQQVSTGVKDVWKLPTHDFQAGNYWLQVSGYMVSTTSGSYGGNINLKQGPGPGPIPEAETWGMMLAGLGALGVLARRRKA